MEALVATKLSDKEIIAAVMAGDIDTVKAQSRWLVNAQDKRGDFEGCSHETRMHLDLIDDFCRDSLRFR